MLSNQLSTLLQVKQALAIRSYMRAYQWHWPIDWIKSYQTIFELIKQRRKQEGWTLINQNHQQSVYILEILLYKEEEANKVALKKEAPLKKEATALNSLIIQYAIRINPLETELWIEPQSGYVLLHNNQSLNSSELFDLIKDWIYRTDLYTISGIYTFDLIIDHSIALPYEWHEQQMTFDKQQQQQPQVEEDFEKEDFEEEIFFKKKKKKKKKKKNQNISF